MAHLINIPLTRTLEGTILAALGKNLDGSTFPEGVPERLEIIDGALQATVYPHDTLTNNGRRAEVVIGTFPSNTGEFWSSFDFKLPMDWTFKEMVMLGSWYPTPDAEDPTKHVTMGFRIANTSILLIVPETLPGNTNTGRTVARAEISRGEWYTLTCRINLQTDSTGFREVYLNRVPILKESGIATTYFDVAGPYFKFGVYSGEYNYRYLRIHFRNASMWSGNDGYQKVMGGPPRLPPRMIQR